MGFCFLCDEKLLGEKTRVSSSVTPHSNVPFPEKIAELLGEEFVVIVTPTEYMCKTCTSLLTHVDKLENDLSIVKTALKTYIQKKYKILPANQSVMTPNVVNGHLKKEELEVGQKKVPSGLNLVDNSVSYPFEMNKLQHGATSKIKIYKCGFCSYQSKDLSDVRFHMRTHVNKGKDEKPNQTLTRAPEQQKKQLFRCQGNKTESVSSRFPTKVFRPMKTLKSVGQQQTMSVTHVDGQKENKDIENTGMLLNNSGLVEKNQAQKQEPTSSENKMPAKVGQDAFDNIIREAVGDIAFGGEDSKTEDLDLESMLALIHNVSSTNN